MDHIPHIRSLSASSCTPTRLTKLIETGHAYYDDTQPEELAALRQRQQAAGQAPGYDNRGRYRTAEQIQESREKGLDVVVRFKVPDHGDLQVEDEVRGRLRFELSLLQDFVILKSDGFPTYHLAHVVDDDEMGITHVIRGEEWIPSLPRHVLIQEALGIPNAQVRSCAIDNGARRRQAQQTTRSAICVGISRRRLHAGCGAQLPCALLGGRRETTRK